MPKIKIGTQLDAAVFRQLKLAAGRERRTVSAVLEDAVQNYLRRGRGDGLARLLARGPAFAVTDAQVRASLEPDPYDQ
jgi:hypothetical protein